MVQTRLFTSASALFAALFIAVCSVSSAQADPTPRHVTSLSSAITAIDQALEKNKKTSVYYRMHGRHLSLDFGPPTLSWRVTYTKLNNPLSKPVRVVMAHAVCRQNVTALQNVSELNHVLHGGILGELESHYLQTVADQLSLKLSFFYPQHSRPVAYETDLKWINRKRQVLTALDDNKLEAARRSISAFTRLC